MCEAHIKTVCEVSVVVHSSPNSCEANESSWMELYVPDFLARVVCTLISHLFT